MAIALLDTEKRRRRRLTFISFTTLEMIGVVFHPAKGTPIQERHFISKTDDDYPIIHKPGFLSLVIPGFGLGPVGFKDALPDRDSERRPLAGGIHPVAVDAHMTLRQGVGPHVAANARRDH
ncbi:MAG: hypothetical protein JWQ17_642 [Tardiphaga sp.]|nr:hypothetical protein [Tardiphaga sp.]